MKDVLSLLDRRLAPHLLVALAHPGPARFNQLVRQLRTSDKLLSRRLTELAEAGLVHRQVVTERPIRVVYSLTAEGRQIAALLGRLVGQEDLEATG